MIFLFTTNTFSIDALPTQITATYFACAKTIKEWLLIRAIAITSPFRQFESPKVYSNPKRS